MAEMSTQGEVMRTHSTLAFVLRVKSSFWKFMLRKQRVAATRKRSMY